MERRAIRDRIATERQSCLRDMMLRGDLSSWLEKRVAELEKTTAMKDSEDAAFMRTMLRSSKRRKRAFFSELQSGTLRRTASEDLLPGEEADHANGEHADGEEEDVEDIILETGSIVIDSSMMGNPCLMHRSHLRVSDHPHNPPTHYESSNLPGQDSLSLNPGGIRVRRNSAGDETTLFCDFGDFNARELNLPNPDPIHLNPGNSGSGLYENQSNLNGYYPGGGRSAAPGGDALAYSTNSESQSYHDGGSSVTSSSNHGLSNSQLSSSHGLPQLGPAATSSSKWMSVPPPATSSPQHQSKDSNSRSGSSLNQRPPLQSSSSGGIYQNFSPSPAGSVMGPPLVQRPIPVQMPPLPPKQQLPPPYRPPPPQLNGLPNPRGYLMPPIEENNAFLGHGPPIYLGASKTISDGGSHDSHNDSGYCARPGGSGGPSPSLSGNQQCF